MANFPDVLGGVERSALGRGLAHAGQPLLEGGLGSLGRVAYKASDPDDGDYFQLAFGFLPSFNLGSALGVENGFLRFAMDALLDPLNAIELPFTLGKLGHAARAARYLSRADKVEQATKIAKLRGLLTTEGRGLEFLDTVRRGDAAGLRSFKDLLDGPADEATLSFFRGEQGRAIRDFIDNPALENVPPVGLAKQAAAGARPGLRVRTPFGLRTLLGDREKVILGGARFADWLEQIPKVGPWLSKRGQEVADDIAAGLRRADGATTAFRAAEAMGKAAEDLAAEYPQLAGLRRDLASVLDEARPAHADYIAARTANRVPHGNLERALDDLRHETEVFASERAQTGGLKAGPERAAAVLGRIAAVTDSDDVSRAFVPYLQEARVSLEKMREFVPGEYRRLIAEYDGALDAAIKEPGAARRLAGSDVLRAAVDRRLGELRGGAEELRAGRIPEARGRQPVLQALERERKIAAQEPAPVPEAPGQRAQLDIERVDARIAEIERLRTSLRDIEPGAPRPGRTVQQVLPGFGEPAQAESKVRGRAGTDIEFGLSEESAAARVLDISREQGLLPGFRPEELRRLRADERAARVTHALARRREELLSLQVRHEAEATGAGERLTARQAEKLTARPRALGLPETGPELERLARLEPAARRLSRDADYLEKLGRALPSETPVDLPAAAGRLTATLERSGSMLTRAAQELRALSVREGARVEPLVRRFAEAAATVGANIGIVSGGRAGMEFREAIKAAWPELGAELDDVHKHAEMGLETRAVESDLLAGLNPAYSHDFGGEGAGIRNLYGAGFDPRGVTDAHFGYLGTLQARARRFFDMNRADWIALGRDKERSLNFMRAFGDESKLALLNEREVGLYHSTRRLLEGFEAIGHGRWFEQAIADYFPRIVRKKAGVSEATYKAALKDAARGVAARGRVTTRFAKPRLIDSLDELLKLEEKGVLEVEKNPGAILQSYIHQWSQVAANQRLVDVMASNRGADGMPLLLERKLATKWAKSMGLTAQEMNARYTELDTERIPALAGYLVHRDHADVDLAFGPQTLSDVIRESDPFFRALQKVNIGLKQGILSFSFFHASAQAASILAGAGLKQGVRFLAGRTGLAQRLGSAGIRPGNFHELYGQAGELVEHAIRHGLQLDSFDKLAADEFQGFVGSLLKAVQATPPGTEGVGPGGRFRSLVSPLVRGVKSFNDFSHKITWEYMHTAGKVFLYGEYVKRLMKAAPELPLEQVYRQAAESANLSLGGLNWRKVFGSARTRARLQYFFLAPDWTLSNLAQARDTFLGMFGHTLQPDRLGRLPLPLRDVASPQAAAILARRFWFNVGVAGLLTMQALNVALTGHTTFENPGGPESWAKVHLGISDEDGRPVFMQFGHQFADPFKLFISPWEFVRGRVSPLQDLVSGVLMGRDRYGTPIRVPSDSASQKSLSTLGWIGRSVLPIPGQSVVKAAGQFAKGRTGAGTLTLLNTGTSMFDLQIRPAPILSGEARAEAVEPVRGTPLYEDLPTTLPVWARPARQSRFVALKEQL